MRGLFQSLLGYFLTPTGLVVMGALDASLVFFLPLGIDFALIIVTARNPELFWAYALLATTGSLAGALATFWIGRKLGEHGLTLFIRPSRLDRVRDKVSHTAAMGVAALAVIPPPFPFTAFVLASGALGVNPWAFFTTLAGTRLLRFFAEAGLAALYGSRILAWMKSSVFEMIVGVLIVVTIVGTIVSIAAVVRSVRQREGTEAREIPDRGRRQRSQRTQRNEGKQRREGKQRKHAV